jgi:DNA repair exonuclease SbcCD ATPase subunit
MTVPATATAPAPADQVITVPVVPEPPKEPQADGRFSAEDLEKVRREEREKLYGRMSQQDEILKATKEELEAARKAREEKATSEAAARKQAEDEAEAKRQAELSAKSLLKEREQEWEKRFTELSSKYEQDRELFAREQEFQRLQNVRSDLLSQAADDIAPELVDLVQGNTEDELRTSVELMKQKSAAIVAQIQQTQVTARASMRGTAPTGYGVGPADTEAGYRQYSAGDIKSMPMSEYAKLRGQLLPAANNAARQGMFS